MSYDYDQTHENILRSARQQFKESGFRDASIRRICKDAGVTNGAFYAHFSSKEDLFGSIVTPCIEGLTKIYADEEDEFLDIKSSEDVVRSFKEAYLGLDKLIQYVCDNREDFLLILDSSAGTAFENYQETLTEYETESMKKFFEVSKEFIKNKENISDNIIKMGASFLISTVFDGLRKGKNAKEIVHETKLVSDYCAAGYKYVLGL